MQNVVDLFMFMGQSNMAGRGVCSSKWPEPAPQLIKGAGYEYRAISSPNQLYPISEPFGVNENNPNGIYEDLKTGSLVTSFTNAYYTVTNTPIIGISASKGGSCIQEWTKGSSFLQDALARMKAAKHFLNQENYKIRHQFLLWCQGETDGDLGTSKEAYKTTFYNMLEPMMQQGIELCFLIRIGHYNGSGGQDYSEIMEAQEELAKENKKIIIVSRSFAEMKAKGLMKDEFHYFQAGYNIVGTEAGTNTGNYVKNLTL